MAFVKIEIILPSTIPKNDSITAGVITFPASSFTSSVMVQILSLIILFTKFVSDNAVCTYWAKNPTVTFFVSKSCTACFFQLNDTGFSLFTNVNEPVKGVTFVL